MSPSSGPVASPQLVAANLPTELAAKLKEINAPPANNMGIIDVAARIKVSVVECRSITRSAIHLRDSWHFTNVLLVYLLSEAFIEHCHKSPVQQCLVTRRVDLQQQASASAVEMRMMMRLLCVMEMLMLVGVCRSCSSRLHCVLSLVISLRLVSSALTARLVRSPSSAVV